MLRVSCTAVLLAAICAGLAEAGTIRGVVSDTAGRPLEGAEVSVSGSVARGSRRKRVEPPEPVTTDAQGRYELAEVPEGRWSVTAQKGGYTSVTRVSAIQAPDGAVELDLQLFARGTIRGMVRLPSGRPATGIAVNVRAQPKSGEAAATTIDEDKGSYALSVDHPGTYEMTAQAEGYVPARPLTVRIDEGGELTAVDLVLDAKLSVVRGQVLAPDGRTPAADAEMALLPAASRSREPMELLGESGAKWEQTGPHGAFERASLEPGTYDVWVRAPGCRATMTEGVEVPRGQHVDGLRCVLQPGATVRGTARQADGEPLAGARLRATLTDRLADTSRKWNGTIKTDDAGSWQIDHVPVGEYTLSLRPSKLTSVPEEEFALSLDEPRVYDGLLEYETPATVEVTGSVRGPDGAPVRGARVTAYPARGGQSTATTAADGSFRFQDVGPGTYVVAATADGYTQGETDEIIIQAGEAPAPLEIELGEGHAIKGRIVVTPPQPLPQGVMVYAYRRSVTAATRARRAQARTRDVAADGSFVLRGLEPGVWDVRAYARDKGLLARRELVEVVPGETPTVKLLLGECWGLFGRIFEPDGAEPLREVSVTFSTQGSPYGPSSRSTWWRQETITDGAGRYEVPDVPSWADPMVVKAAGRAETVVPVKWEGGRDQALDIVLHRGAAIRGAIAKQGAPLPFEGVRVLAVQGRWFEYWRPDRSNYEFRAQKLEPGQTSYELTGLSKGTWTIGMWGSGFAPPEPQEIEIGGEETITLDMAPTDGGAVAGRVTNLDGAPVGRTVLSGSAWGRPYFRDLGRTAGDGSFLLDHLPAGRNRVMVRPSAQAGCKNITAWVDVVEGETVACDLQLRTGWALKGTVQPGQGRPLPASGLYITADGPTWDRVRVQDDGTFQFEDLAPGEYALELTTYYPELRAIVRQEGFRVREEGDTEGVVLQLPEDE